VAQTTTTGQAPAGEAASDGHAKTIDVTNPATGEVIATVPALDPEQVAELVRKARAAQPGWEALGFDGRAKLFRRAQKWVSDNQERICDTIVSENGKAYEDALAEVLYAAGAFGFWAGHAEGYLADEKVRSSSPFVLGRKLIVRYAPVGVVGVIGPWNYPLLNSFGDCIPALAAGNSVVLKPASITPLTSLLMQEMLRECGMPEDVFQVCIGPGGDVGDALIDAVDAVMFTGSTEVGKIVMERAAKTLTPVALELGGKDPMIVLADADLERAANGAVHYTMQNGGQTCTSVERVYVEEPIYDRFVAKVEEKMRALRQGVPGAAGSVDIGAITSPPQVDLIDRHVKDAVAKGARVLVGGRRGNGGGDFRHEGPRRGGGRAAGKRRPVRAGGLGLDQGHGQGRAGGSPGRGRRCLRQRRAGELHGAGAADGRLESLGPGLAPRAGRHPQVHEAAVHPGHPLRAQARPAHAAV
jgi:acyl-CoA reductase-like NAD-dependent aldehyde dehydrogenase